MEISDARRQRLSELAKKRHAEGGFAGGGRPRGSYSNPQRRVAQRVIEAAQEEENARQIIDVFLDAINKSQPIGVRLKAAEAWLGIEQSENKLVMQKQELDSRQHSREELIEILAEKLTSGPASVVLRKQLEGEEIVDAEVVEDAAEAS